MEKEQLLLETETYIGPIDKACHAYGYKRTKRTDTIVYVRRATLYIYHDIYVMHYCMNIVTEKEGEPCAVFDTGY
jgi:DNA-3-methyladenine glycosylase